MGIFSSASKFVSRAGSGIGASAGRLGGSIGEIAGTVLGQTSGKTIEGLMEGLSGAFPGVQVDPALARRNLEQALGQLQIPQAGAPELAPITLGVLPTADAIDLTGVSAPSQFAGQQQDLISLLQGQVAGTGGPSLAEQLLKSEQEKNLRSQLALAASLSGRALPAAQRQVLQQQAVGAQEALQQAAILRAQEQLSAQEQLGATLGTARGQDIGRSELELQGLLAQQQAQQEQARLAEGRLQFEASQRLEQARLGEQSRQAQAERDTAAELERARQRAALEQAILTGQMTRAQAQDQLKAQTAGAVLGAAGSAGAAAIGGGG